MFNENYIDKNDLKDRIQELSKNYEDENSLRALIDVLILIDYVEVYKENGLEDTK